MNIFFKSGRSRLGIVNLRLEYNRKRRKHQVRMDPPAPSELTPRFTIHPVLRALAVGSKRGLPTVHLRQIFGVIGKINNLNI